MNVVPFPRRAAFESGGVFLSAAGVARARDVHNLYRKRLTGDIRGVIDRVKEKLFDADADSFDDFYIGVYALNLVKDRTLSRNAAAPVTKYNRRYELSALLKAETPRVNIDSSFEETLINEYMVADIPKLIHTIKRLLPYRVNLETFGLGCVWLQFGVYVNLDDPDDDSAPPFLDRRSIEQEDFDPKRNPWIALRKQFGIYDFQLK